MALLEGRSRRRLALLGVCAAAVVAAIGVAASFAFRGGGAPPLPTTGAYAPISVPKPATGLQALAQGVDPDTLSKQGADLVTVISRGTGARHYKLTILNTSNIGYIDSFYWSPPAGVTIDRVISSSSGHCALTGTPGYGGKLFPGVELYPKITCGDVSLKPPTCTCASDGGRIVISFTANTFPSLAGSIGITSATPILKTIPSYVQTPDLPTCGDGQVSTDTKPCSASS
jgi:hypothetical protein